MKFGNKKPEKIPMYVYYIIAGVIIVLLNMLVVPAVQERSVQKTDYSTFIENVEDGNVTKATVIPGIWFCVKLSRWMTLIWLIACWMQG